MGRIQRIWQLFKTASSKPVPALIGIGIEVAVFSFWRLSKEFQTQMQDGIPLYHLCPAPWGHAHNTPSPSRGAEIKCQKKVLHLRLRGFIEKGYTDLITQRFPVVKVMVEGEVLDIKVIWNSKSNGHNATLWAPGFMLDDIGDVKEMMVKWLAIPVAVYLNSGSPPQNYSQSAGSFTKSGRGILMLGQCSTILILTQQRDMPLVCTS